MLSFLISLLNFQLSTHGCLSLCSPIYLRIYIFCSQTNGEHGATGRPAQEHVVRDDGQGHVNAPAITAQVQRSTRRRASFRIVQVLGTTYCGCMFSAAQLRKHCSKIILNAFSQLSINPSWYLYSITWIVVL